MLLLLLSLPNIAAAATAMRKMIRESKTRPKQEPEEKNLFFGFLVTALRDGLFCFALQEASERSVCIPSSLGVQCYIRYEIGNTKQRHAPCIIVLLSLSCACGVKIKFVQNSKRGGDLSKLQARSDLLQRASQMLIVQLLQQVYCSKRHSHRFRSGINKTTKCQ